MKRSRRRFLRRLAATVGGGSLAASAGCRRTPDAPSEGPTPTDGDQTDASPTDDGSPTPTVSDGTTASTVATDIDPLDGSWRSYRRDAANTAATDDPGPTEQPALAWRRSATMDASPETDPVAVDGAFAFVSTGGRPYALDGDTGRIRWQADRTASTDVDPVAIDGNVVVADGETVSNVAGDTGEERWTAPLDGAVVGLAAGNGSVVAATDSGVTALEPGDGSERWHHSVDGTVETPPAVGEETVAVRVSTAVLALDAASGEQRWRGSAGDAGFPPAVGHGHVYVASERRLRVLNEADGAEKWTVSPDLPIAGPPVVSADSVFLPTMNDDAEREGSETGEGTRTATPLPTDARRFEADVLSLAPDGSERWRAGLSGRWNFTSGSPELSMTTTADRLVVRVDEGLFAFDAADGEVGWQTGVGFRGGAPAAADGVVSTGAVGVAVEDGADLWRFEVGDRVESSPAVVGNTLYVGSDDTHLYAVAANSGGIEWRGQTGGQIKSSPAVGDDAVYVGSQDGFLYAFERGSGSERWRFDTGGAVESSPTLHDGTVYVGSESGSLFAVEATDGTESWRVDFGDQFLSATPAVADGVVYAGANETFRALDAADGSELWRATFDGGRILQSIPAVADGRAFVNSGETLHAFDAADGTELWTRRIGGAVVMTLAVDGDTVYAVGGDYVYAFDVADGTRHWRADVGFGRWVVVGDDAVFARGANDAIVALDPEDGAELWRQAGVDSTGAPAVAGEYLFVGDFEGRISAIGPVPE